MYEGNKKDLIKYANHLGYSVRYSNFLKFNGVVFKNKEIWITPELNKEAIFGFLHELGHCVDMKNGKLNLEQYKRRFWYKVFKELTAWINGYEIGKLHNCNLKGYWKHGYKMWSNYLFKRVH